MRLRELRKYRNQVVRLHLRRGIGDVMGRLEYLVGRRDGCGYALLYTRLGDIAVDCRVIKSATPCKAKKLSWGG